MFVALPVHLLYYLSLSLSIALMNSIMFATNHHLHYVTVILFDSYVFWDGTLS